MNKLLLKLTSFFAIFLIVNSFCIGQTIDGESVIYDEANDRYLCPTFNGISQMDDLGNISWFVNDGGVYFGSTIVGNSIYVTQTDRVKEFDLTTQTLLRTIMPADFPPAPGGGWWQPNDITSDGAHLFVTGPLGLAVFVESSLVNIGSESFSGNGSTYDFVNNKLLYFSGGGDIYSYTTSGPTAWTPVLESTTAMDGWSGDGMCIDKRDRLITSSAEIKSHSLDFTSGSVIVDLFAADINYDRVNDLLLLPDYTTTHLLPMSVSLSFPTDAFVQADDITSIMLSWPNRGRIGDTLRYEYEVSTDMTFATTDFSGVTENDNVNISLLSLDETYYWRVRPIVNNWAYEGYWSTVYSFTTNSSMVTPPPTPTPTPTPVGIAEIMLDDNGVIVYPTIVSSTVTIEVGESLIGQEFKMYDTKGQIVVKGVLHSTKQSVGLSNLSNGIYKIAIGKESYTIIKKGN